MFNCFLNNTLFLLLPKINFCLSYVHYHRAEKCNFLENDLAWFENLGWIKLTLGTNYLSFFSSEWTSVINYPSCFLVDALINYTFKISPVKFTKYLRIFFHKFLPSLLYSYSPYVYMLLWTLLDKAFSLQLRPMTG